ncbi:MAG TPA: single-stranded-DNA-specific exonuclease RecJ [Oscillatoriales cyanobacterium M59_W2019_021]|nr:single-stranded-DNA-specific exonuclease RecJ [Oscillatoriales cyanobacterium M59_W2019_021]
MVSDRSVPTLPRPVRLPNQRWHVFPPQPERAMELARGADISPLVAQILLNRALETPDWVDRFLDPESDPLPAPSDEFPDLAIALDLLREAIDEQYPIAICGDYDADGMTSTALLLRAFSLLGGNADYAIPSRMSDGYGINDRIVREFAAAGVRLILTVDNGISAHGAIELARELEMDVIITDHHDLPPQLPEANAILNPKMLSLESPYRGMAGVGVAYLLALSLAQGMGKEDEAIAPLQELMTLGTIADLAPLTGINRRWVQQGLKLLPHSQIAGIQALIQISGAGDGNSMKPDDIGFRLGPRINAVGRIGDPQIVIELLTTDDEGVALERAMQCEAINRQRQEMCAQIEAEAIAVVEGGTLDWQGDRVLLLVRPNWHHGVIGIVASRLVERYGVPVFIGTYEDEAEGVIRGSARGIPEFHVFEALQTCDDLLGKYGGHKAAGGFSFPAENLEAVRERLRTFACQSLEPQHLKPLVTVDAQVQLEEIDFDLYQQIDRLHPWGIGNPEPIFWTANVRVLEQGTVKGQHLKAIFAGETGKERSAIAWRWGEYCPLPSRVDIAYKIRENRFNGNTDIELELVGVRLSNELENEDNLAIEDDSLPSNMTAPVSLEDETPHPIVSEETVSDRSEFPTPSQPISSEAKSLEKVAPKLSPKKTASFEYDRRYYSCGLFPRETNLELRIRNDRGQVLAIEKGQKIGLLGTSRENSRQVNVSEPRFYYLIKAAMKALALE